MDHATLLQSGLAQCYVMLWLMASLINLHTCFGGSSHSHRYWSPMHALCVVARMMCDVMLSRHTAYLHVLCVCVLGEVALMWHLTTQPRRHRFAAPNALACATMQGLAVVADLILLCYLQMRHSRVLARG